MKDLFKTPEIEIVDLSGTDVVCTSGVLGEDVVGGLEQGEDME